MSQIEQPDAIRTEPGRIHCRANRLRLGNAHKAVERALSDAAVEGFYGEVRLLVSFQDGVVQTIKLERSQTIR